MSPASRSLYALDLEKPAAPRDPPPTEQVSRDQILQVRRVTIVPPFDGSSLVYRTPNGTFVQGLLQ
jgi:hypothetical protein